jgi:hypothetical protein
MFDRAARAAWRVGAAPYVEIAVLTALARLLQDVTVHTGIGIGRASNFKLNNRLF